jgi:hypothetical protein
VFNNTEQQYYFTYGLGTNVKAVDKLRQKHPAFNKVLGDQWTRHPGWVSGNGRYILFEGSSVNTRKLFLFDIQQDTITAINDPSYWPEFVAMSTDARVIAVGATNALRLITTQDGVTFSDRVVYTSPSRGTTMPTPMAVSDDGTKILFRADYNGPDGNKHLLYHVPSGMTVPLTILDGLKCTSYVTRDLGTIICERTENGKRVPYLINLVSGSQRALLQGTPYQNYNAWVAGYDAATGNFALINISYQYRFPDGQVRRYTYTLGYDLTTGEFDLRASY